MSIRLRLVDGRWVALCAARSVPQAHDVYLDDGQHHALALKFGQDFNGEGLWPRSEDEYDNALREREESDNENRVRWDATFGWPR